MAKHEYAEKMQQLADDCQISDTPWEFWECKSFLDKEWAQCSTMPLASSLVSYRRKPDYIDINGFKVPKPLASPPETSTEYFLVDTSVEEINSFIWEDTPTDFEWLRLTMIHLTEEAAELHRKALLSFTAEVE